MDDANYSYNLNFGSIVTVNGNRTFERYENDDAIDSQSANSELSYYSIGN
jgi:hypothetical protein